MRINLPLALILLAVACFSTACTTPRSFELLIDNARIVDVATGKISEPMIIGISGDTIRTVLPEDQRKTVTGDLVIDAKGKYLMPGLWDMHVHFRGGDSLVGENKAFLDLFLDHGITRVRDAGGDMTQDIAQWRTDIQAGVLDGPDIFTSGPKLDGEHPSWPGSLKATSPEGLEAVLDSLDKVGADYVKIYDGSLTENMFYEIIKQAENRGYKVTGHMPMDASLQKARSLGLDGIEHLYYLLASSAANGDSIRALKNGYQSLPLLLDNYDREIAEASFNQLAQKPFYVTPTLHITKVLDELRYTEHSRDSLLQHIGKGIVRTYERRERSAKGRSDTAQDYTEKRTEIFTGMVLPLHRAGAILLAGSDCGAYNSYVYPGASLHEELILMTEAGLSPAEALATSVINGPEFFGLDDAYGKVAKNRVAHLILLDENPLEDIRAVKGIRMVIKNGKVYAE